MVKILSTGMTSLFTTQGMPHPAPANKGYSTGTNRTVQASFVAPDIKPASGENGALSVSERTPIPLFQDKPPASRLLSKLSGTLYKTVSNTFAFVTNEPSFTTGREFTHIYAAEKTLASGEASDEINPAHVYLSDTFHDVDFCNDTSACNAGKLDRQRRELLECMRKFAGEAYTEKLEDIPDIGNMKLSTDKSTPTFKIWESTSHPKVVSVVLGFSGTRMTESADLLCDIRGQLPLAHVNSLNTDLPSLGHIGAGWQERWQFEASKTRNGEQLADILTQYAQQAQKDNKLLSVNVVGHSLGAAVATLASIDIANFLRSKGAQGKISAYVFNPPRLGFNGIAQAYRNALAHHSHQQDVLRFSLIQLTRELDPVQSMPLFMNHPDWAHLRVGNNISHHQYISTFNDRSAHRANLAVNHELEPWKNAICSGISAEALKTLFGEKPGTEDLLMVSRREMFHMIRVKLSSPFNQQA
ncbi:XopAP family type III secretion system effector [Brenneria rubrifaciens]